jgi:sec-independent protein translocase protein TatC
MRKLHVLFSPAELTGVPETGRIYLPVDALRSSVNVAQALLSGASEIYPFESDYSLELFARTLPASSFVRAVEKDCLRADDADLGNSPSEFTPEVVAGRRVLMSTSNGTPLLKMLEGAGEVVVFSLANLSAAADYLSALDGEGVVVCSGWKGGFALEDAVCAGALAVELVRRNPGLELTEAAEAARTIYARSADNPSEAFDKSDAGRRLRSLGFEGDVAFCSRRDTLPVVPVGRGVPLRIVSHDRVGNPAPPPPPPAGEPAPESEGTPASEASNAGESPEGAGRGGDGAGAGGRGESAGRDKPGRFGPGPKMSLGRHLEELRKKIIGAVLIILAAFVVCFLFSQDLVDFLLGPVDRAFRQVAEEDLRREYMEEGKPVPGGEDLEKAVRERIGTVIAFTPQEVFLNYVKVSLIVAVFLSAPLWMFLLWSFVAAGLYPGERRYIYFFAPAIGVFFWAGVLFLYFVVLPIGLSFLLGFGQHERLSRTVGFGSYMNFCLLLSVLMGIVFQLPLVMLFLTKVGLVKPSTLAGKRRYVILGIFVGAALITPPDVITQLLLAAPLLLLFEVGLVLSKWAYRSRTARSGESGK